MDYRVYHVRPDGLKYIVVEKTIYTNGVTRDTDKFGPFDDKYLADKDAEERNKKEG